MAGVCFLQTAVLQKLAAPSVVSRLCLMDSTAVKMKLRHGMARLNSIICGTSKAPALDLIRLVGFSAQFNR